MLVVGDGGERTVSDGSMPARDSFEGLLGPRSGRDPGSSGQAARPQPTPVAGAPGPLEIWLYAVGLFLLTGPFTFWLMGADPNAAVLRDLSTMREESGSQWRLYAARFGTLLVVALINVARLSPPVRALPQLLPIAPFLLWAALSLAWSDAVSTSWHSLASLTAMILAVFVMAVRLPAALFARAMMIAAGLVGILSVAWALLLPGYGVHQHSDILEFVHAGAWRGIYMHKNFLGQTAALCLSGALFAGAGIVHPAVKWGIAALMLFLIVMSTSASALAIVPLAALLVWLTLMLDGSKRAMAVIYFAIGAVVVYFVGNWVLAELGRDPTFTGRTDVWSIALKWIQDRPVMGYGYTSLTYGGFSFELFHKRGVIDPHNAYLDLLLGVGAIGLMLFVIAVVAAWMGARRMYLAGGSARDAALVLYAVFMAWLVSGVTEASTRPLSAAGALGFAAMIALITLPAAMRSRRRSGARVAVQ